MYAIDNGISLFVALDKRTNKYESKMFFGNKWLTQTIWPEKGTIYKYVSSLLFAYMVIRHVPYIR